MLTECVQEEQYCTCTYDESKDDGVPALPEVDSLYQAIHNWKSVRDVIDLGLYSLEGQSLSHQMIPSLYSDIYLLIQ